jgi:hypothetical protein
VFVNRRVWTPPVRRAYVPPQRAFREQRFEGIRPNLTGGNREWNRNHTAPAVQLPAQRSFTSEQPSRDFTRQVERQNVTGQPPVQQRNITPPRQMEQRNSTPQPAIGRQQSSRNGPGL